MDRNNVAAQCCISRKLWKTVALRTLMIRDPLLEWKPEELCKPAPQQNYITGENYFWKIHWKISQGHMVNEGTFMQKNLPNLRESSKSLWCLCHDLLLLSRLILARWKLHSSWVWLKRWGSQVKVSISPWEGQVTRLSHPLCCRG